MPFQVSGTWNVTSVEVAAYYYPEDQPSAVTFSIVADAIVNQQHVPGSTVLATGLLSGFTTVPGEFGGAAGATLNGQIPMLSTGSYWLIVSVNSGQLNWNFANCPSCPSQPAAYTNTPGGSWTVIQSTTSSYFAILGTPVTPSGSQEQTISISFTGTGSVGTLSIPSPGRPFTVSATIGPSISYIGGVYTTQPLSVRISTVGNSCLGTTVDTTGYYIFNNSNQGLFGFGHNPYGDYFSVSNSSFVGWNLSTTKTVGPISSGGTIGASLLSLPGITTHAGAILVTSATNVTVSAGASGTSYCAPIFPVSIGPLGQKLLVGVPMGVWSDPPAAPAFHYFMTAGSLFTQILNFPPGFNNPFSVSSGGVALGSFTPGQSFTFPNGGVSEFTVSGISPAADPSDGFPLQLAFNTATADFAQVAIPAPLPASPTAASPASGSGSSTTFTFTFSDTGGSQNLTVEDVLINAVLDGRHACYLAFVPSGPSSGTVYLVDDAGDAGGPYQTLGLPGNGSIQNSQCTIGGAGSAVSTSGNTLTLTLPIVFGANFAGNKVIYMSAQDTSGVNSGWLSLGTWNAPGTPPSGPWVTSMTPARTTGSGQSYAFTFTDSNGWQDISVANILANVAIDGRVGCYLAYVPSSASGGTLYLVDSAGDAGGPYAGMVIPGSGTVSNSQCTISGSGSSVAASGNTLTLTLPITFSRNFAGDQVFYLAARSSTLNSGWQSVGSITVPQQ